MYRLLLLALALSLTTSLAVAQIQITGATTQDFTGFTAAGLSAAPTAGQLNSNHFAVHGFSDGNTSFGDSPVGADFGRGLISSDVSSAGIYAVDFGGSPALIIQSTGSEFTPGAFYVRYQNATGSPLTSIGNVAYQIVYRNNQPRANSFNFGYATGACVADPLVPIYTDVPALNFTSPDAVDANAVFVSADRSTSLTGLGLANGDCLYLRFSGDDVSGSGSRDEIGLGSITVNPSAVVSETATVGFNPTTGTVQEGGPSFGPTGAGASTSFNVVLDLSNEQGGDGLDEAVSGTVEVTAGNAAFVSFTGTYNFPIGSANGATAPITISAIDDNTFTGTRDVVLGFGAVTGGTGSGSYTLTILEDDAAPPVATFVVINEIDADQPTTDNAEFIELYDGGVGNTELAGLVVVLINGNGNISYGAFDLDGQITDANGYFVLCADPLNTPNCDLDVSPNTNLIQNGPDAVALYVGDAGAWPNGTAATTTALQDAVVYGLTNPRESALLASLGRTVQFQEGYNGNSETESLQRLSVSFPIATFQGAPSNYTGLLYAAAPTPGTENPDSVVIDATPGVSAGAGWRMLSMPAIKSNLDGFRVDDLAGLNLVQGIAAGTPAGTYPAQYPTWPDGPNLFTSYAGSNVYDSPAGTDDYLLPGSGFFWYWYDQDVTPDPGSFGTGTSVSFALNNPAFSMSVTGIPYDDVWNGAAPAIPFDVTADGFYLVGNPFAYPYHLGGGVASSGTVSDMFNVWDPTGAGGAGSYSLLTANFGDPVAGDAVAPWNAVFAEITGASAPLTFSASSAYVNPTVSSSIIGRSGSVPTEQRLSFLLTGELAGGQVVGDEAAIVRFADGASEGWDFMDGSKLRTLVADYALIAPVGQRDDGPHVQAARSLPASFAGEISTPLAFLSSGAGTYTLSWDGSSLPSDWSASLRDLVTGTVTDMMATSSYAFSADEAADWTNRFDVVVSSQFVASEPGAEMDTQIGSVYPNPTSGNSILTLRSAESGHITATVYDALGRKVAVAFDAEVPAGAETRVSLPTESLSPGVYVVRVSGDTFVESRQFVVAR